MQFDYAVHCVASLDAAVRDYRALGFTVQPGGQHPGSGTCNAAWRLDTRYIELIAVCDEPLARAGIGPGWPEIEATLRRRRCVGLRGPRRLRDSDGLRICVLGASGWMILRPDRSDGSTGVWHYATLQDRPRWAPFFINYGLPIDQWTARSREQGFPMDPWALHGMTVQVPDPAASASWLGNVFALDVVHIGQDAAEVRLRDHVRPRSCGSHRRGRPHRARRPQGSVAGLRYLDTSSTGGNHPIMTECDNAG